MLIAGVLRGLRRDERGFTLIETLVAVLAGVIVTGALLSILEVSMRNLTRVNDFSEASQQGRTTMTHLVDELHSACVATGFTPVLEGNKKEMTFVTAFGSEAEFKQPAKFSVGVRKVRVYWEKTTGKEYGNLKEVTTYNTGGGSTEYEFEKTSPAAVIIGERIEPTKESGKEVPIFQYYKYAETSSSTPTAASNTLETKTPLGTGTEKTLSASEAASTASVLITFTALARDGSEAKGRPANLTNQITFALEAPSSEATIQAAPCE